MKYQTINGWTKELWPDPRPALCQWIEENVEDAPVAEVSCG